MAMALKNMGLGELKASLGAICAQNPLENRGNPMEEYGLWLAE
ncbi:MAG: hypothetical protein ACI350_04125 [Prevotella sp.]